MNPAKNSVMRWDVFCRVIDNFGDVGVCWRLCADLGARGHIVRLWIDDARALTWMAPDGAANVQVLGWACAENQPFVAGDVVIEAFGCELPTPVVQAMADGALPPIWINLEYLSAERYVERSHRLQSPQSSGPGQGLVKWFYYPGFTAATGGLLRETGLAAAQACFDGDAWLLSHGLTRRAGEQVLSLFCYDNPRLDAMLRSFAEAPVLLLLTADAPLPRDLPTTVRTHRLPRLTQIEFDHLLWASDFNFVRGEDSFVRAQWAGKPFVWQIYPQDDGVHAVKLQAFLDRHLTHAHAEVATEIRAWTLGWNGLGPLPARPAQLPLWAAHARAWGESLAAAPDLVTGLRQFVSDSR
ncbi:MAG: hypothetical protein RLZZ618_2422 [Pseudomonadota bacterium]